MKGLVFRELLDMVEEQFGLEKKNNSKSSSDSIFVADHLLKAAS